MKTAPSPSEIRLLFDNSDPAEVWGKARDIVERIDPHLALTRVQGVFDDVVRLFRGEYPGYRPINTLYHDLHHTLDVFLCATRLLHGAHVAGIALAPDDISRAMIAALLHDIGYAQLIGDDSGTGAKYTQTHVDRGIEFMHRYLAERNFPPDWAPLLETVIGCTDPTRPHSRIAFSDEKTRLLGQLVATADLVGQMADRTYLEKLLFLYFEFKEAHLGNFHSLPQLLRGTRQFYDATRKRLDGELGGLHTLLKYHFKEWFGVERDYYLDSITSNIDYLARVVQLNEADYLLMLKRGGIVEKLKGMALPEEIA